jgi:hypothetical protein
MYRKMHDGTGSFYITRSLGIAYYMENGLNCKVSKEQNVRMIYNVEL